MSLTPTQLSELQTIVEALRVEFPSSDDVLWEAAIRIQKGGLGPVTGPGGQPAFDTAVADIVLEAEQISTVQGRQGGLGNSVAQATFNVVPVEDNLPPGTVGSVIYLDVAPNTYLSTDVIELTPAGPNSVVLSEVGTQIARSIAAASGGMEVNNLSTGAGFERVLTVSDAVVAGITIEDEGVPLATAADTLNFVGGGVTAAGAGTTKTITIPAGAVVAGADTQVQFNDAGAFGATPNLTWDDNTFAITNTTSSAPALQLNVGNNPSAAFQIDTTLSTNYIAFRMNDQTGANFFLWRHDYGLSTPNHELTLESSQFGTIMEIENEGNMYLGGQEGTAILQLLQTGTSRVLVENVPLYLEERGAAGAAVASEGMLWVRNDVPNNLMFTDDAGTDFVVAGSLAPTGVQITGTPVADQLAVWTSATNIEGDPKFTFNSGASSTLQIDANDQIFRSDAGVNWMVFDHNGGSGASPIITFTAAFSLGGSVPSFYMLEQAAASTDFATFGQIWVRNDTPNTLMFTDDAGNDFALSAGLLPASSAEGEVLVGDGSAGWREGFGVLLQASAAPPTADEGYITLSSTGTVDVRRSQIFAESVSTQSVFAFFETAVTDGFYQRIVGNGADRIAWGREVTSVDTDMFSIREDASIRIEVGADFFLAERAAAAADIAAHGQLWVRSDTPNVLMFTGDDGVDHQLTPVVAGVTNPMTADLDGDGFDLDDMGVMFMREQATSDADVTGQGQLWVRTDTFSNTLMFTNDNGNDMEIMGLPLNGDILDGTLVLTGTGFVGAVNLGPKTDSSYMLTFAGAVAAPSADDIKIQLTVDTNSLFLGTFIDSTGQVTEMRSNIGTVVTNTVIVPTDGSTLPSGGHTFTIVGHLHTGATAPGTLSLRAAKNADTGADGGIYFPAGAVQFISVA